MPDLALQLKLLEDALREETRKERRNLLIVSALSIAIVKAELVPKQVSALGIDSEINQKGLFIVLTGVTVYFLLAFLIYCLSDVSAYYFSVRDTVEQRTKRFQSAHPDIKFYYIPGEGPRMVPSFWPAHEELDQLRAELRELVSSYNSVEISNLASKRAVDILHLEWLRRDPPRKKKDAEKEKYRAAINELGSALSRLGARKIIDLQDQELRVHLRYIDNVNQAVVERGKDLDRDNEHLYFTMLLTMLRLGMDFIVPVGVAIFAVVSLLRGR